MPRYCTVAVRITTTPLAAEQTFLPAEYKIQLQQAEAFFADWRRLDVPAEPAPPIDCDAFSAFAQAFAAHYPMYCRSGLLTNVWQLARVGRDELRNSQILAWILDCHGDHGHQSRILEKLVEYANSVAARTGSSTDLIPIANVARGRYVTRTEAAYYHPGETDSRVDIEIEGPGFYLVIEVKVDAAETGNQLRRYVDIAKRKRAMGRMSLVLFLTPSGRPPADESLRPDIVPISWQQFTTILRIECAALPDTFSRRLFVQFADHICTIC